MAAKPRVFSGPHTVREQAEFVSHFSALLTITELAMSDWLGDTGGLGGSMATSTPRQWLIGPSTRQFACLGPMNTQRMVPSLANARGSSWPGYFP